MAEHRSVADPADRLGSRTVDLLECGVVVGTLFVVFVSSIGLATAMAGVFEPGVVAGAGVGATLAAVAGLAAGWRRAGGTIEWADPTLAAPVAMVAAVSYWSAQHAGQIMLINRDPGSYLNTARWLERDGSLTADAGDPLFAGISGVRYSSPAVYDMGSGDIEFQFSHGAAAVFSVFHWVLGPRGLFAANVVLGALALLALYCVMRRLDVDRAIALGSVVAFAVSIPFLYATRGSYSEPGVLLLVMAAVLVLLVAADHGRPPALIALAGAFLGTCAQFRVDGLLYVGGLLVVVALFALTGSRRAVPAAVVGAICPVVIGLVDLNLYTGRYAGDLSPQVRQLNAGTVATFVLALGAFVVGRRLDFTREVVENVRSLASSVQRLVISWLPRLAFPAGIVTSLVLLGAWLVRPEVQEAHDRRGLPSDPDASLVAGLQAAEGAEVDPTRSYAEFSVVQIGWYFGVLVVAAAVVGFGIVAFRAARRPGSRWAALALFAVVAMPVYLWRPGVFPDHPWFTRRYVPFVYPAFVVAAAVTFATFARWCRERWGGRAAIAVGVGAVTAVLLPTLVATWPLRELTQQRGSHGTFVEVCERIEPGTAVLTVAADNASMTLRAWCGATVASVSTAEPAIEFAERARTTCRPAAIVSLNPRTIEATSDALGEPTTITSADWTAPELTIERRPENYVVQRTSVTVWPVVASPDCG